MNSSQSYELAISVATDADSGYLNGFTSRQVETIHDMLKVINLELFWKKEDELKQQQQEIESLKAQLGKQQEALKFADSCFKELEEVLEKNKAQLAQYQSDDCVVVKKDDKTIVAIEKTVESQLQASGITDEPFRLDGEKILNAMIEAQEKDNDTLYTLRCNNCMTEFEDDYDLETCLYDPKTGEFHDGCPICLTDEYMMNILEKDSE